MALRLSLILFVCVSTAGAQALEERFAAAAREQRLALDFDGMTFSGPAWELLVEEGLRSQFFLIGEEHGIAENPKLAAQLFSTLAVHGYSKLAIEISPPMAQIVDGALRRDGLEGLRNLYANPGGEPAFFGMREEAELLHAARAALPEADEVLWGIDYEVAGDRQLIDTLKKANVPPAAEAALAALSAASIASWARWEETGSPQFIFSFAGDPRLVVDVRDQWPDRDASIDWMLETLETTFAINQLWIQGENWQSNRRRADFIRSNFLRHWAHANEKGDAPRVMLKAGASHLVRGRNTTGTFDLGTLLPELAMTNDVRAVSMLVLPGAEAMTAVLDPSSWTYEPRTPKDGYRRGLELLTKAAYEDRFTLINLAGLRSIAGARQSVFGERLLQVVHGFDYLLVMNGSTASGEFEHEQAP